MSQYVTYPSDKKKGTALLLCIFLGLLGVHNFYAGYTGRGVAQLLLCWTGISSLWAFIELFTVKNDAKGVPMRPSKLLIVLLILILVGGVAALVYLKGCGRKMAFAKKPEFSRLEMQKRIYFSKGFVAGKAIKADAPGKLLLIIGSGAKYDMLLQELIRGLEQTRGGSIVEEEVGGEEEITADMVNRVISRHPDAGVIAFAGTLPYDYSKLNTGAAKLFLFDPGAAELRPLKADVESGRIIGIVWSRNNQPRYDEAPRGTDEQIFDRRYIIITKGNIGANAEIFK